MSRNAVSAEHFVILAHFDDFNFPANPSNNLFIINRCRSFNEVVS